MDAELRCLWCGGETEQRPQRGGWKRPDLRGSHYTEAQLRALHVFHMRDGLSLNELGRRTFEAAGYKSPLSAAAAISRDWKRLGLTPRDRIAQVRKSCTIHGLAPKHGPRPGYGTYKRREVRGEPDQPLCDGIRQNPPRKGEPCGNRAKKGSRFCDQHDPETAGSRVAHLDQLHAATRERLAATALPMDPFAAYVKQCWVEEGSLAAAAVRTGINKTAVSRYAKGRGTDGKPKRTVQWDTVQRAVDCDPTVTFADLYPGCVAVAA